MNVEHKNIYSALFITLIAVLMGPTLFPSLRILFFAPFLVIIVYQISFLKCLWVSFFCGLLIDILSSNSHLGLYAGNYVLTTALIYHQRRNFFSDSISTLPLMTLFFSVVSTLLETFALYIFEKPLVSSWKWIGIDFILLPVVDALYSLMIFVMPTLFLKKYNKSNMKNLRNVFFVRKKLTK